MISALNFEIHSHLANFYGLMCSFMFTALAIGINDLAFPLCSKTIIKPVLLESMNSLYLSLSCF